MKKIFLLTVLSLPISFDYTLAMPQNNQAVEPRDPEAQYDIGMMYYNGEGVAIDPGKAFHWLSKAAEQEHDDAQYMLGMMYYYGDGVPEDIDRAFHWLFRAADQGHMLAHQAIGELILVIE